MALLPILPRDNVLTSFFYAAGAVAGLASGLLEVFAGVILLGLQMAIAQITCSQRDKGRSSGGTSPCSADRRNSSKAPQNGHPQQQRRTAAVTAAVPQPTARPSAPSHGSDILSPAPPTTPQAALGPAPTGLVEYAAPAPAVPLSQDALIAAPAPPAAEEGPWTSDSAAVTLPDEGTIAAGDAADPTPGPAVAALSAGAPLTEDAGAPLRPTSVEALTDPASPADVPNGHHGSPVAAELLPALPPVTHGSANADTPLKEPLVPSDTASPDEEGLSTPESPSVDELPADDASSDLVVPTSPLVPEPVLELSAGPPHRDQSLLTAGRGLAGVEVAHDDGGDEARSEGGESGITAVSYATANSVDPATGAPVSRRLKAASTTASGQSVTQRLEEKRQSGRRKGAQKAKPR